MTTQAYPFYTSIPSVAVKAAAAAKAQAAILYIPQIQDGPRNVGKTYVPELHHSDMSLHTIVADIASAQHENVVRVLAIDVDTGRSWDATKEVAHLVLDVVLEDEHHVPDWCRDFLEEHLGVNYIRSAERGAA